MRELFIPSYSSCQWPLPHILYQDTSQRPRDNTAQEPIKLKYCAIDSNNHNIKGLSISNSQYLKKKTICFLHDVGFVDCGHSVSPMGLGIVKGIFSHPKTCLTGNNLQTFNHTSHHLTSYKRTPSNQHVNMWCMFFCKHLSNKLTWCSRPLYSPSVFSRMVMRSTSS